MRQGADPGETKAAVRGFPFSVKRIQTRHCRLLSIQAARLREPHTRLLVVLSVVLMESRKLLIAVIELERTYKVVQERSLARELLARRRALL